MQVKILGSAAGGGFPQWNCACANCAAFRAGKFRGSSRSQTQIAVRPSSPPVSSSSSPDSSFVSPWLLINASPDLRMQILGDPEFAPRGEAPRQSPIGAVVLTGAEVDQVMGLLHLREFQPLQIFCFAQTEKALREGNSLLRVINRENQMQWQRFEPGKVWRFPAAGGGCGERLSIEAVPLDGDGGVVGLWIECGDSRMFCAPSLPDVNEKLAMRLNECDVVLVDGTFWSDDELVQVRGAGKTARQMGHLPIAGAEGTMARLAKLKKPRKIFIHVNNTNPILNEEGAEYREVRAAAWEVATDGMEIRLG